MDDITPLQQLTDEVLKLEDIKAQIVMQKEVRQNLNTVSDMISQIEWMRKQIYDMLKQNDLAGVVVPEIKDEPGGVIF